MKFLEAIASLLQCATYQNLTKQGLKWLKTALITLNLAKSSSSDEVFLQVLATEDELRAIFNAMTELVIVMDGDGRYLKVVSNPQLLVVKPELLLGRTLFEVLPQEQAAEFMSCIQRAIAEQCPITIEYTILIESQETWFAAVIYPLPHNKVTVVARDISEIKAAAIALREKKQQLIQTIEKLKTSEADLVQSGKMALLGQLVAGIAHEINTPLGAIQASINNVNYALQQFLTALPQIVRNLSPTELAEFMSLLEIARNRSPDLSSREERQIKRQIKLLLSDLSLNNSHILAEHIIRIGLTDNLNSWMLLLQHPFSSSIFQTAAYLGSIATNSFNIEISVTQAAKIVAALKNYARQDTNLELVNASVIEGIEAVLAIYHNKIKRGIEVVKNYNEVPNILCYPEKLSQVWSNIIGNALQAMNYQGKLEISVHLEQNDLAVMGGSHLVVAIADNGPGIPLELQEKVFEPFFTTKPYGEGTGLGLDIAKKIVFEHGGQITLNSQPGSTTFTTTLPILVEYT